MNSERLTTKDDLVSAFNTLGVSEGIEVMVHSSMSSLGYVVNGALDVIDALLEAVGPEGTLLMPAHTGQLTDPADWKDPELSPAWVDSVRRNMKPYDPRLTPVRNRGLVAQTFLSYPGVLRSSHPLNSIAAKGKYAFEYIEKHHFDESEGPNSPCGVLYDRKGSVLLLGVSLASCTALHLAEFLADVPHLYQSSPSVLKVDEAGFKGFFRMKRYPGSSQNFVNLLEEAKREKIIYEVEFGSATLLFFRIRPIVDLLVGKLQEDPKYLS